MPNMPTPPNDSPDGDRPAEASPRALAMADALGRILDRVKGSREVLPLMAALEQSLRAQGLKSIDSASLGALSRIASQLSTLPVADDDAPMRDLQGYLLHRLSPPADPKPAIFQPSLISSANLEVSEGSFTDFMAMDAKFRPPAQ